MEWHHPPAELLRLLRLDPTHAIKSAVQLFSCKCIVALQYSVHSSLYGFTCTIDNLNQGLDTYS